MKYKIQSWDDVEGWMTIGQTADLADNRATLDYISEEVDPGSKWRIVTHTGEVVHTTKEKRSKHETRAIRLDWISYCCDWSSSCRGMF
jgi:hypothetical protein